MAKTYMKLDDNLIPVSVGTVDTSPKEEQTKTVTEPNFSSGDVVVTPDAGKVLTQVTVVKDNDLVPENIIEGVNIFGVVGTAETVIELTQAQYDAFYDDGYDNNTYYLIVEE